jgi:hypothetical protein
MSYNGTGTFNINTAGQPVVTGTTITSTAFNLLTADLATGLTTALTKDGQTTPTANIPMGTFKLTGLGAGTSATDAAQYGQLQAGATTIATVTGTDTLTGSLTPAIAAYATGNLFSFVAAATNTGAATINLNSLGAKSITKSGTTALAASDLVIGRVYLIEYDGTRFQLINPSTTTPSGILPIVNGGTGASTLAGASIATYTGTETLTNKTIEAGTFTNGYTEEVATANTSTAYTIDLANGSVQILTLTGNCVYTFPTPVAGKSFILVQIQDATGSRTVTWPSTVDWPSATAPTLTATASKVDKFVFTAISGTSWLGSVAGQNYTV